MNKLELLEKCTSLGITKRISKNKYDSQNKENDDDNFVTLK